MDDQMDDQKYRKWVRELPTCTFKETYAIECTAENESMDLGYLCS
jgi:hypothetical protein